MRFVPEHIGLAARDSVALKDWYARVLGGEVVFASVDQPPAFFVRLHGGLVLEIYPVSRCLEETPDNFVNGWRHLALQVESIATARADLEAKGVKFTEPVKPAGGGGSVLYFRDSENNLLHLVERPDGSPFRIELK